VRSLYGKPGCGSRKEAPEKKTTKYGAFHGRAERSATVYAAKVVKGKTDGEIGVFSGSRGPPGVRLSGGWRGDLLTASIFAKRLGH
jgi:hypothetical protein